MSWLSRAPDLVPRYEELYEAGLTRRTPSESGSAPSFALRTSPTIRAIAACPLEARRRKRAAASQEPEVAQRSSL